MFMYHFFFSQVVPGVSCYAVREPWTTVRNIFTIEGHHSGPIYRDILRIQTVGIMTLWDMNYRSAVLLKARRMLAIRLAIQLGWHRISLSSQILVIFTLFAVALGVGVVLFVLEYLWYRSTSRIKYTLRNHVHVLQ